VIIDSDADLTIPPTVFGAFYQLQSRHVYAQRIIVHAAVYDAFKAKLVARTRALAAGNPAYDEATVLMIDVKEAARLGWLIN
jgi:acyl-CoA reductase-like NAD-dependent aldehyde dehydrogenase